MWSTVDPSGVKFNSSKYLLGISLLFQAPPKHENALDPAVKALPELLDVHSYASSAECLGALRSVGATVWVIVNPEVRPHTHPTCNGFVGPLRFIWVFC